MSVRSFLRRIVRRSKKPLVMAGIAGALSLSLVITTPSNAQAFVPAPVLPAVWGATTMAIPSLMPTAAILGPVGWGAIAVAAVGVGLYATKDYWLPYVTGAFGEAETEAPPPEGNEGYGRPLAHIEFGPTFEAAPTTKGPRRIATIKNTATTGQNTQFAYSSVANCQTTAGAVYNFFFSAPVGLPPQGVLSIETRCTNVGDTMLGGAFYAACTVVIPGVPGCTAPGTPGPKSPVYWGTMQPASKPAFDPRGADVIYRSVTECISPDGKYSEVVALSRGDEGGLKMASCEAAGKGHGTGKIVVWATPPGTTEETKLWETQRVTEDPEKPLCSPGRPTSGCKLGVSLDGKPCVMGNVECENWSDLRNDPNHSTRLSCQYGPYQVSMETCNPLERAYEPGGAPATEPNTDGNPYTRDDTQPDGNTQPKPSTDPNAPPATGTAPGAGGFPITGNNPAPSQSPNCASPTWSWNPVDFVKSPVMCALQDAFVPKQDIQARSDQLRQKSMDTVPIAWLSPNLSGPGGGGCPNWTINVAGLSKNVVCDSSFTQALLGVRTPLFGLVAAAMVWPLIRGIWYAAIPVLRVSPGSSK